MTTKMATKNHRCVYSVDAFATCEVCKEKLGAVEVEEMLNTYLDIETSDELTGKRLDKTEELISRTIPILEWLEEFQPNLIYKRECQFPPDVCRGYQEGDTGAWICGNEDNCPAGIREEIGAILKEAKELLHIL